eukprot:m.1142246 g.1142246  ORF g.1142246 m.1142246 type:complete len:291 (-) comp24453_c0_seq18:4226-5098(-)
MCVIVYACSHVYVHADCARAIYVHAQFWCMFLWCFALLACAQHAHLFTSRRLRCGTLCGMTSPPDPIQSADEQDGPFTIISNTIENIAVEYHGCAGICAGYVANTDIVHNQLTNTSNGAICLGWGWGANNTMHNNRVNYNHIVRSNTELYDCGSIYTLSSQPNSEVAYNYIENQVLRFGSLYHDARSAHFHTHHNVVVGGPMWLYLQWGPLGPVDNILVENNYHNQTVAGGCATPQHADTCQATGFCPTKYSPCGNVTIQNNTVVDGDTWPAEAVAIEHQAGPLPQHNLL